MTNLQKIITVCYDIENRRIFDVLITNIISCDGKQIIKEQRIRCFDRRQAVQLVELVGCLEITKGWKSYPSQNSADSFWVGYKLNASPKEASELMRPFKIPAGAEDVTKAVQLSDDQCFLSKSDSLAIPY